MERLKLSAQSPVQTKSVSPTEAGLFRLQALKASSSQSFRSMLQAHRFMRRSSTPLLPSILTYPHPVCVEPETDYSERHASAWGDHRRCPPVSGPRRANRRLFCRLARHVCVRGPREEMSNRPSGVCLIELQVSCIHKLALPGTCRYLLKAYIRRHTVGKLPILRP